MRRVGVVGVLTVCGVIVCGVIVRVPVEKLASHTAVEAPHV